MKIFINCLSAQQFPRFHLVTNGLGINPELNFAGTNSLRA